MQLMIISDLKQPFI